MSPPPPCAIRARCGACHAASMPWSEAAAGNGSAFQQHAGNVFGGTERRLKRTARGWGITGFPKFPPMTPDWSTRPYGPKLPIYAIKSTVTPTISEQLDFWNPPGRNDSGRGPDADRTRVWPFLPGGVVAYPTDHTKGPETRTGTTGTILSREGRRLRGPRAGSTLQTAGGGARVPLLTESGPVTRAAQGNVGRGGKARSYRPPFLGGRPSCSLTDHHYWRPEIHLYLAPPPPPAVCKVRGALPARREDPPGMYGSVSARFARGFRRSRPRSSSFSSCSTTHR
eukprot:gene2751-biopygen14140